MKPARAGDRLGRHPDPLASLAQTIARVLLACWLLPVANAAPSSPRTITLSSLLEEMADRSAVTRLPDPAYECLQASSYNRASTNRTQPNQDTSGWFADSDGLGFLRTESIEGRTEWVIMEHNGSGCLTRLWTPYFYYDLNERTGPNVRIYLDGEATPVIDESLIRLVTGRGSVPPPFAVFTARAGDLYLPIPFARSCKVTMTRKPFYHLINYRAYSPGTPVETFNRATLDRLGTTLDRIARELLRPPAPLPTLAEARNIPAHAVSKYPLPRGERALRRLALRLPGAVPNPALLRSTILRLRFDGEETVWCPVGDFFSCADSIHPFQTWHRTVSSDGTFVCEWVMPYRKKAEVVIENLSGTALTAQLELATEPRRWDSQSLHFHAKWRPDDVVPGTPFQDWNYVDIRGQGIYVGDSWTVVNPQGSWWGEGDEKIYVDGAWERGFPTHFGTGSEDYYGWAGGEVPTRRDEFSTPFLANVRVGGLDGFTTGYNICVRSRSLDAIPFHQRLRFDMESSFGTDIREPWNLLGYSVVTYWYARPGAVSNRAGDPAAAGRPILTVGDLKARAGEIRRRAR